MIIPGEQKTLENEIKNPKLTPSYKEVHSLSKVFVWKTHSFE